MEKQGLLILLSKLDAPTLYSREHKKSLAGSICSTIMFHTGDNQCPWKAKNMAKRLQRSPDAGSW